MNCKQQEMLVVIYTQFDPFVDFVNAMTYTKYDGY